MKKKPLSGGKVKFFGLVLLLIIAAGFISPVPEEGMYPLSEISKIDLKEAGLEIEPDEIYNPNGISLVDALVNISGCTGSFVSDEGLIFTNHHCAFRAINNASTPENNILQTGFLAKTRGEEIPAPGYTVRITESYQDVSEEVLAAAEGVDDLAEKERLISQKMRELSIEYSDEENNIEARVSEMFAGQTYVLFKYRTINDVRLVYNPPMSIGNFGGDTDNWEWPRHTGDFSFMRAYVAPDGSAAEYSENNVPYKPKKHLQVNPEGVNENDFVFILGYPGRTYRHQPYQFIEHQLNYVLPMVSTFYQNTIDNINEATADNPEMNLSMQSFIKGLANVEKNYRGKILGIKRIQLVEKKKQEEELLKEFINSNAELKEKYSGLFAEIDEVYSRNLELAQADLWFNRIGRLSSAFLLGDFVVDYVEAMELDEEERPQAYRKENVQRTIASTARFRVGYLAELQKLIMYDLIMDALKYEESSRIMAIDNRFLGKDKEYIWNWVNNAIIELGAENEEVFMAHLDKETSDLETPFFTLVKELDEQQEKLNEELDQLDGAMLQLLPQLTDAKRAWKKTSFIPDANGTLRLTYGYIKGYSPRDAVYMKPITTLEGVIDKSYTGKDVYEIPEELMKLYEEKDYGQFYDEEAGGLPVGILYNMDTSGGNSGSPIMDSKGRLIGINFDRSFEATINDYAWNESYSRSIGVDIRYVLWVTQKLGGADFLLEEMGVKLQ